MTGPGLLEIRDLAVEFAGGGGAVRAVDGATLAVAAGEVVGLVGETGCGKTATALAVLGLLPPGGRVAAGRILFDGTDLVPLPEPLRRRVRGRGIGYVPQEPGSALNPVLTAGDHVADVLRAHEPVRGAAVRDRVVSLLGRAGLDDPAGCAALYPHELSGGMKQRVLVAAALAARPRLLLADEPTTAIDASLRAGLLALFRDLAARTGLGVLLITHDLWVAAACDRVAVMYAGRVVEDAPAGALADAARHPYTRALLAARPSADVPRGALPVIPGGVPAPGERPAGCAFRPRCPLALPACGEAVPSSVERTPGHRDACLRGGETA